MKKVVELIRVSTREQAASDRAAIPAQRTVNRQTCQREGLEIVRSIEFADVSGASVVFAPEIQELIRLIQSPEIDGVVAREFSRLMRPEDLTDFALLQAFSDTKTILYLPEGPIDFNNKGGRLLGIMRAAIAGMERTEILERVWTAKEEKRRRGELAQSSIVLPFGVAYEQGKGFYFKPEAELVRQAFKQFLAGNQSYLQLAKMVGVSPRGMHNILRNPIWTGWRVIDKKRDTSAAGRYPGKNGRQADRRKIERTPDEVIRVMVIDEPLISQDEFDAVQRIMDVKQKKHWRSQPQREPRFTYNGFLTCSACGEMVHTALARRDYYACKGRRVNHKCQTKYMDRGRLEEVLDGLFAERLTDPVFLEGCLNELHRRKESDVSGPEIARLTGQIRALRLKRGRVLDSYFDGLVNRSDLDQRLASIDQAIKAVESTLSATSSNLILDSDAVFDAFAALAGWEFWTRKQKRVVLAALVPEIRVADYRVESLGLNPRFFSNDNIRTGRDSWPRRA